MKILSLEAEGEPLIRLRRQYNTKLRAWRRTPHIIRGGGRSSRSLRGGSPPDGHSVQDTYDNAMGEYRMLIHAHAVLIEAHEHYMQYQGYKKEYFDEVIKAFTDRMTTLDTLIRDMEKETGKHAIQANRDFELTELEKAKLNLMTAFAVYARYNEVDDISKEAYEDLIKLKSPQLKSEDQLSRESRELESVKI